MNHILKFNELYVSTYRSAAKKLIEFNRKNRARKLIDHSKEFGISEVDRIDTNKYEIVKEADLEKYSVNDIFEIIGIVTYSDSYLYGEDKDVVIFQSKSGKKVYILVNSDILLISVFNLQGDSDKIDDDGVENFKHSTMSNSDYDDYEEEEPELFTSFSFQNRKDARNFKNFLINEFGDKYKDLNIHKLYKDD